MTLVHTLMNWLASFGAFIADFFGKLLSFLAYPLGFLLSILDGIWYFLTKLFYVVVAVIHIFVSLFQFLGALGLGFLRTIRGFLTVDFSQTPLHYPSWSNNGLQLVYDVLSPTGLMTVVPSVFLAVIWILFILRIFALLGDGDPDA